MNRATDAMKMSRHAHVRQIQFTSLKESTFNRPFQKMFDNKYDADILSFAKLKCYLIRGQFDSFTNVFETRILVIENKPANESAKHIFEF